MVPKPSFLLAYARSTELRNTQEFYDEEQQLNVIFRSGEINPLVSKKSFGWTESKTMQAPGDDDPDPEDEGCY